MRKSLRISSMYSFRFRSLLTFWSHLKTSEICSFLSFIVMNTVICCRQRVQNAVELSIKIDESVLKVLGPYLYLIVHTRFRINRSYWFFSLHKIDLLANLEQKNEHKHFLCFYRSPSQSKMKKFDVALGLIWLILLLKPETRAADYRAFLNKRGKELSPI